MLPVKGSLWAFYLALISLGLSIIGVDVFWAFAGSSPDNSRRPHLKLVGTIVGNPASTYAIIEDLTTRTQGLYQPGDRIQEVKIVAITRNQVVIERGGRRVTLRSFQYLDGSAPVTDALSRQALASRGAPPESRSPTDRPREQTHEPADPAGEAMVGAEIRQVGDNTWSLTSEVLSQQFDHLHQLLRSGRLTPLTSGGQPYGFMLTELVKNSFLERIGLRNGDILKEVDGQKINGMADALQAYQQLLGKPIVQLEVERDGHQERFTYEIR